MAVKIFVILLVVLAVGFFVTMDLGAKRNNSQPLPNDNQTRASTAQNNLPSWIAGSIGRLSPKLTLPQTQFQLTASLLPVDLPAASSRFRNATFRVTSGCRTSADCSNIEILYTSKQGEGSDLKLDSQWWQPAKDQPDQASIVVLQSGGELTFRCTGAPGCKATAELQ